MRTLPFSAAAVVFVGAVAIVGFAIGSCNAPIGEGPEPIDFPQIADDIKSITVYDTPSLKHFSERSIPGKEVFRTGYGLQRFKEIAKAVTFKKTNWVLWKGGSLGIVELNSGEKLFLAFSYYGNFFRVQGVKGIYLPKDEALEQYAGFYDHILYNIFHPARMERNREEALKEGVDNR